MHQEKMAENRDNGAGLRDEGKSLKGSDTQQREEEEKAKEFSKEGKSSSSSTPTEIPVASELGDTSRARRAGKEVVQDTDEPIDKRRDPLLTHPTTNPSTKIGESKQRIYFMFDIRLTPMDAGQDGLSRLFIPVEMALKHFPCLPKIGCQLNYEKKVKISSTSVQDRVWSMTIKYDRLECAFLLNSREWYKFSDCHHLKAKDLLRFFKVVPFPRAGKEVHFQIQHVKRDEEADGETTTSSLVPEFRSENFLFHRALSHVDIRCKRLYLRKVDVRNHFRALGIPAQTHMMERLYFTDAEQRDWCMKITFSDDSFMIDDGWKEFLEVHKVVKGDVIRFYKPTQPIDAVSLKGRYFLIQHVKKEETAATGTSNDPSQPGTSGERKDGDGGDKERQGESSGGRKSHGAEGKAKKSGVGNCCMA